jgi:hypothetical protein
MTLTLFSGLFNVARNLVSKRHIVAIPLHDKKVNVPSRDCNRIFMPQLHPVVSLTWE